MSDMVRSSVTTAIDGFLNSDTRTVSQVKAMETAIDHLQNDFTFYLAQLSSQELSEDVGTQLPPLLHSINDLERISDHAMNIAELTDRVASERLEFSDTAKEEMKLFYERIVELFDETVRALEFQDAAAIERAFFFEDQINKQQKAYLSEHTARLCRGQCNVMSALVFVDFINNLEKMADHLTNVAQASSSDFHFREPSDYLESVRPEPV
jgi:phosphate:Na+ symporter